jgi:predicted nucleic acid-binding protein
MYNGGMREVPERVYVDSSVVSGLFDSNDHPERVRPFWDAVFAGSIRVVLSDVLDGEIKTSPQHVRDFFDTIPKSQIERIVSTDESDALAKRYITEGIVKPKSLNDSRHVALASIAGVDVLVSFNCKHIVKLNRILRYNAINVLSGYTQIEIRTPDEVIYDET